MTIITYQQTHPHVGGDDGEDEIIQDSYAAALLLPRCGQAVQDERHDERVDEPGDVEDGEREAPQLSLSDYVVRRRAHEVVEAEDGVQHARYPRRHHEIAGHQRRRVEALVKLHV